MKIKKRKKFIKRTLANIKYALKIYGDCDYCQHSEKTAREHPCYECAMSGSTINFEIKTHEPTVLYTCDRKQCETCNPDCEYTRDIKHAAHFYEDNGYYLELPSEVQP